MFGLTNVLYSVMLAQAERQSEVHFYASVQGLPEDERHARVQYYLEAKEKSRLEAIAERRHQELCAAIKEAGRRASFWP